MRGHNNTTANEVADKQAKAAAASPVLPLWSLNTAAGLVHQHDTLMSGVNTLLPTRQALKKQSRARHSAELWKLMLRHYPELGARAPTASRATTQLGGTWRDAESEATVESCHNNAVRREFALKLPVSQLPTLARQHKWSRERYPTDRCCRCDSGERETWQHILKCADNGEDKRPAAGRYVADRVAAAVTKINGNRLDANPPHRPVDVWKVTRAVVPANVLTDIGCLLGRPDSTVAHTLKANSLTNHERNQMLSTITAC